MELAVPNKTLIYYIINEQISGDAQYFIKTLYEQGNNNTLSNLRNILLNNNFSNDYFDSILNTLIKHEFVYLNQNEEVIINHINILNVLRFPKFLYLISAKYGEKGKEIIEIIMEKGIISVKTLIKKLGNFEDSPKHQKVFLKMIDDEIIIKTFKIQTQKNLIDEILNITNFQILDLQELQENAIYYNPELNKFNHFKINYHKLNKLYLNNLITMKITSENIETIKLYQIVSDILNSPSYSVSVSKYNYNTLGSYLEISNDKPDVIKLNKRKIANDFFYHTIEKILDIFYTNHHIRIFRLISISKECSVNEIRKICAMKIKEISLVINDLIKEGLIIKGKEKDIYHLNPPEKNINLIKYYIELIFSTILRIKQNLNDNLMSNINRISLQMQEDYLNRGYSLINQFDEMLFTLIYINNLNKEE